RSHIYSPSPIHHTVATRFIYTDPATTELSPLSLHDALPISDDTLAHLPHLGGHDEKQLARAGVRAVEDGVDKLGGDEDDDAGVRSEEHTSELQSRFDLVCRLLLEKKKLKNQNSVTLYKHHST